jgi:hypothetical protein
MQKKVKKPKDFCCEESLGGGVSFQYNGKYPTIVSFRKKLSSKGEESKQISYSVIHPDECRELARWFKKAANYLENSKRKAL